MDHARVAARVQRVELEFHDGTRQTLRSRDGFLIAEISCAHFAVRAPARPGHRYRPVWTGLDAWSAPTALTPPPSVITVLSRRTTAMASRGVRDSGLRRLGVLAAVGSDQGIECDRARLSERSAHGS